MRGSPSWSRASTLVGSQALVGGPVESVLYEPGPTGSPRFLNIGVDYPNPDRFTVIIWGTNRASFVPKPEAAYRGEAVCVRGLVRRYRGVPQMQVSSPDQIIIDSQTVSGTATGAVVTGPLRRTPDK